jgi:subfamily B ATP-binding cassette protein MsbA
VTVVTIAHRVYVLEEGRVIQAGTYEELRMREDGEFREMVEMQSL